MKTYLIGGVYWDAQLEVAYVVTDREWDREFECLRVCRADLDYACYGRSERGFWYCEETDERDACLWTPPALIWI